MHGNPYWPLNGPSFFSVPEFRRCFLPPCMKVDVGSRSNFAVRMASRRPNFSNRWFRPLICLNFLRQALSLSRGGVSAQILCSPLEHFVCENEAKSLGVEWPLL